MPIETFPEIWALYRSEVETRNERLLSEYRAVWRETSALLASVSAAARQAGRPSAGAADLAALAAFFDAMVPSLAAMPIQEIQRLRPLERALGALEAHESGLEDLARRLPATVAVTGPELLSTLGENNVSDVRAFVLRRRGNFQLPLRAIGYRHFLKESGRRAALDGPFLLTLSQAVLATLAPWQEVRKSVLVAFTGQEAEYADLESAIAQWATQVEGFDSRVKATAAALQELTSGAVSRVARAIAGPNRHSPTGSKSLAAAHHERLAYWSRQQRAILSVISLEHQLLAVANRLVATGNDALRGLDDEQESLLAEMEAASVWLRDAQSLAPATEFPQPRAKLLAAEEHAGAWLQAAEMIGPELLPAESETVEPTQALPSARAPWRSLHPRIAFHLELNESGYPVVVAGFRQSEASHQSIVRELARAREVAAFSLELAASVTEDQSEIAREGLNNALSLIEYQQQTVISPRALVARQLAGGAAATLLAVHTRLDKGRLGVLTHLVRQRGSRAARALGKVLLRQTAAGGRTLRDLLARGYHWLLLTIGWEPPPITTEEPVVARGYFGDLFKQPRAPRDLPSIYRRLFRLAPVEDPRFLVGRQAELAALAQAKASWDSGRSVAVLLMGARGSGKTSLLNCAAAAELAGPPIVRAQFSERIAGRESMHTFLRSVLQIPEEDDIVETLSGRKSIVVIEELERTFIRRMGGFDGLRELLSIVSATTPSTFWVLGINEHAFAYLNAATGMSRYFTHRINAMAISPENLKKAILLRHNLSGLRLKYPAVDDSDPRIDRVRRALGLEQNAADLFFDSLYYRSEGIFRGAFELWQQYIERVEAGALTLQLPPDYSPEGLIAQLNQDDYFTLQAILQHGSLTAAEHAAIFECPPAESRIRLQRLVSLECLQPDPGGPGLRICPEVRRVVHTALHRVNLI